MNIICVVYGFEKRYDDYHRMYRRCNSCNTKLALKHCFNTKDKILERMKNHYHNNKEIFSEEKKKRKCGITDLENQINTLTDKIKSTNSTS